MPGGGCGQSRWVISCRDSYPYLDSLCFRQSAGVNPMAILKIFIVSYLPFKDCFYQYITKKLLPVIWRYSAYIV